jgi:glycine betaine/proline transport system ATP-binding protein
LKITLIPIFTVGAVHELPLAKLNPNNINTSGTLKTMTTLHQIECNHLWKVFGPNAERFQIDSSRSKEEILEQTGHVVAVQDVSFKVRKGEIFVIMGLSGSGKSTLIRCMSRLIEPTSGQVLLEGNDILTMAEELLELRRHRMSMVFQHFGLFAHRPVLDNVAYGLEVQGVDTKTRQERAKEMIKLVGLQGWEYHYPTMLSGGMQQRVGIARALAVNPEILLFDEPFSALDPLIRRELQDELLNLQKQMQKTILFITHDFLEAVKLGDHIAIMKDGAIVQVGTPVDIVMHPATDYVREFTKDVPKANVLTAASISSNHCVISKTDDFVNAMHEQKTSTLFVKDEAGKCLGKLVAPSQGLSPVTDFVTPTTKLNTLLGRLAKSETPLPVIENGRLLGTVDRTRAMMALANEP